MKKDMTGMGVTQDVAPDRKEWRRRTRPTTRGGYRQEDVKHAQGKRRRGRPNKRWLDNIRDDMKEKKGEAQREMTGQHQG